jgi:hypothetical protein
MKDVSKPPAKIADNPEGWDLSALIAIFHDHFEAIFSKKFSFFRRLIGDILN